jgi:hydrophobic/amphiphilic exporter-1 (mainly G- bacteria), HAE1 family
MIRFFAAHPTAANLLLLALFIVGALSIPTMQRETFPEFESDRVRVTVVYPGASAEDMEEAITQRVEDAVNGINYLEEYTSESREGVSSTTLEMEEGGTLQEFVDDIRNAVDAINTFPADAEDPVIVALERTSHVVSIAVTGSMSVQHLKEYTEQLKRKLQRLPEISKVSIQGFSDRQIQVEISTRDLKQYGLTIDGVANAISRQSLDIPTGTIESTGEEVLLRFADKRRTLNEFKNIVIIGGSGGAEIRLGEIAKLNDRFELAEGKVLFNGDRGATVSIAKSSHQDTLVVYDAVKKFVDTEKALIPENVTLRMTYDLASIIRARLDLLVKNGWQGLILVFMAMFLFFNIRMAFWVAMGLPASFLGALFLMDQMGYTINMMTTVALIISIGILMDDAIVIAENVATHLQKGKKALEAVVDGVSEVKNGVIASFLTTACVFLPLGALEGRMGKVLMVIPIVLLLVLAVSLIEAFLILPHHLSHSFGKKQIKEPGRVRKWVSASIEWQREQLLGRVVDMAVRRKYLTVGLLLMLLTISVAMLVSGRLKFKAFPEMEGDSIEARILLPQGTPLSRTEATVDQISSALKRVNNTLSPDQKGGRPLVENVRVQYGSNSDANESGPHLATVAVDLVNSEFRTSQLNQILGLWRQETGAVTDVITLNFTKSTFGPAGKAIKIQFKGDDLDQLKSSAEELAEWLRQFEGVYDIFDDMRPGKPEIVLNLKKGATMLGMNTSTVASQIRSAFSGKYVGEVQVGTEDFEIYVQLASEDKNNLNDLRNFELTAPNGAHIPVSNLADITQSRGYARIARVNGMRTLTLQGALNPGIANTSDIMTQLKTDFLPEFKKRYPTVEIAIRGETERAARTGGSMATAFLIGVIGIFIILSYQFKSYTEPLIIMMAIPFAIIGAIWGHLLMGLNMSMPSLLGFIALSGIVVNDSILLVEFLKNRRSEGMSTYEAATKASRERFRAVILTSITTIAGLLPLLLETDLQAQFLIPIATSMAFGLLASTLLILIVVPCFYAIADDLGLTVKIQVTEIEEKPQNTL